MSGELPNNNPFSDLIKSITGAVSDIAGLVKLLRPSGMVKEAEETYRGATRIKDLNAERRRETTLEDLAKLLRKLQFEPDGIRYSVRQYLTAADPAAARGAFETRLIKSRSLLLETKTMAESNPGLAARHSKLFKKITTVTWGKSEFYLYFGGGGYEHFIVGMEKWPLADRQKLADKLDEDFNQVNRDITCALEAIDETLAKSDKRPTRQAFSQTPH